MAQRGVHGGKPVAIDDMYECDEVARDAQLEVFFQRTKKWFDALSKQLTALVVGNQPQNYHPNPCFVEEEEDLNIKQEGCNIKEDDEYIERVYLVDWDSPPIYDDYPEDFSQEEKIELDKNKVIYIRVNINLERLMENVIDPFWEDFIEQELIEVNKRHE